MTDTANGEYTIEHRLREVDDRSHALTARMGSIETAQEHSSRLQEEVRTDVRRLIEAEVRTAERVAAMTESLERAFAGLGAVKEAQRQIDIRLAMVVATVASIGTAGGIPIVQALLKAITKG